MAKKPAEEKMQELFAFKQELLAKAQSTEEPDEVNQLSQRVEALWTLLKEKLGLTDDDLRAEMAKRDADRQSGQEPASKAEPKNCPKCGRAISRKTNTCFYCGGDEKAVNEALKRFGGKPE